MKILSRMLSKKVEPQKAPVLDQDDEIEQFADDSGRRNSSKSRDALFADPARPIKPKPEEPEVAASGWESGDWNDDWDDDEEWGDDDVDVEERRKTQDKKHLVSEIREAMVSVSRIKSEPPADPDRSAPTGGWSDDEDFGRRARARSQLTAAADDSQDRILEKTEDAMSDRETSRRRSAMAHMKAAAAATKADRVLRQVASRDPSADPEEQSPYRDDLAKVVRPHSTSRPISRQVSRPNAPSPIWDQGAGDEDAALFAAAEDGVMEDPAVTIDNELSAAEAERLARAPVELSEEDFAGDEFASEKTAENDFPGSRFADDDDDGDLDQNAFEDIADDFEDEYEDFTPRPSSVVSEAVAFANAPDEEIEVQPEAEVRKKIWEMADEVASEVENARLPAENESSAEPDTFVEVMTSVSGRAGRSAGRVKTRLLGFQSEDQTPRDMFESSTKFADASSASALAPQVTFPAGWIVVVDGPGRGSCFSLHVGVSQIGRGEDQAVRLDFGDTSISRNNHAAVAYDDEQGKFFLGHGGKSNLVRLNGMPVLSTEEMSNNDEIRIGETTLKFVALCGENFTWSGSGDNADNA